MQIDQTRGKGRKGGGPTAGSFQPGNRVSAKENLPKGRFITQQLIRQLHEDMADFDPTNKEAVKKRAKVIYFFCKKLIMLALDGDTTAIKLIMDRVEGTPTQTVMFSEIPDGQETPDQLEAISATREKIRAMKQEERIGFYRASLTEAGRTVGSA